MLEPLEEHRALGILYSNLALQDAAAGHETEAVSYFMRALESHRRVGDEEGLAITYSQLGRTFLIAGRDVQAERSLNNASEHFVKLGNEPGVAAVLRLLAQLYEQRGDLTSALRCLERVVDTDRRYRLPETERDVERLARVQAHWHGVHRPR
jgi:tetratricopeptide (TPR) repeat protein